MEVKMVCIDSKEDIIKHLGPSGKYMHNLSKNKEFVSGWYRLSIYYRNGESYGYELVPAKLNTFGTKTGRIRG